MNVAFDASAILGRSGIERYSRELIKGLLRTHSVDSVTLATDATDGGAVASYFSEFSGVGVRPCLTHERRLGAPMRPIMRAYRRHQLSSAVRDADLVHLLAPGKIIPQGRPVVTTIHDLFPMYPDMGIEGHLARRFPGRIRRHLQASDAIMCPSAYVASTIQIFFPNCDLPIHVTPLAAGDEFTPTPLSSEVRSRYRLDKPFVLFIGRVDPRKNLHRMMFAWKSLPASIRRNAEFVLMMAGGADAIERFRSDNASVMDEPSIRIISDVSTSSMVQILSAARALAFATLGEGFGLPVLEAMRCGCPVITSNTTSLPEVGGSAALYVDPTTVDEIALMMQRCIEDDELVAARRAEGIKHSAAFTWDVTARATAAVYNSVVG
ncbi:MAG: glycosyltransferase family 4 protein [Candidatus Kapabacteria bacterium]|nr:glycosyltransferase family 4 protein [Candidatus Kapabacteria bacterium]